MNIHSSFIKALLLPAVIALLSFTASADSITNAAKEVFEQYVKLEKNFDPELADLYSDDAIIKNKRHKLDGTSAEMTLPAPTYKKLIRSAMPIAKQRGDLNAYSDIVYKKEGDKVRVTASRYSELKKYSSPLSLLIGKVGDNWLIVEELSESKATL